MKHGMRSFFATIAVLASAAPAFAALETPTVATTTLAEQQSLPAPGITATISDPFYKITAADIGAAIAEQLKLQAVETKAEATLNAGTPSVLYSADHPVTLVIHTLQVDTQAKRWQAQAYFVANGKTESVKPIAGTYAVLVDVPVLTRQFNRGDIIEDKDITIRAFPERQLRKDTVTDAKSLIGLTTRSGISPDRPIHTSEITPPMVIKRGDLVEMLFSTPYIKIKTTGIALEDGAKGAAIRVKNQKSERAVSAVVLSSGRVQVNSDASL